MIELISETNAKAAAREFSGLNRKRVTLSAPEVQNLLRSAFPNTQVTELQEFPIGGPNQLIHVHLENIERQLAIKIVNKGAESKHDVYLCTREAFALEQARSLTRKVPEVYAVLAESEFLDRPYFIMECIEGQPLSTVMANIPINQIETIGREFGEALENLHSLKFSQYGDLPIAYSKPTIPHYKPIIWSKSGELVETFIYRIDFIIDLYVKRKILALRDSEMLRDVFHQNANEFLTSNSSATLVQTDIDPKNIMVSQYEGEWHFSGLIDFDRSLALPAEADLGIMENRWSTGASNERLKIYHHFKAGLFHSYQPDEILAEDWKEKANLFHMLESLERIYNVNAREHLTEFLNEKTTP